MTEQQPYQVVRRAHGYEVRRYPPCMVAEVAVQAPFELAGTVAFGPLVNYIGGNNRTRESLAMTAPVVQAPGRSDDQVIAFVLPASVAAGTAPEPTDPRVVVSEVPGRLTAVVGYSGRWTRASFDAHVAQLRAAMAADGLTAVGEPRFARFDPPFKPWFLRRNEVHIDVAE